MNWIKLIKASLSEEEKNNIIVYIQENNFIPLENNKYYFIVRLNDENIKMTDKFKSQLKQEGLYNKYYASGIAFNNKLPISMDNLPIFGNSNKYDTSWFKSTPKDCLNSDLKDKQLNLSNRINKKVIKANNKIDKVYLEFLDFIPFMNTMIPNYKERSEKKTYIKAIKDFAKKKNVSPIDLYRKIKQEMPEFVSDIKEKDMAYIEEDSKDEND